MPEYILIRKGRNTLSTLLHILFNILLGVGSILITIATSSWILGIILVIISKWRMFAVRPRYLLLNLKSSVVDLVVGASIVIITYCSGTAILPVHFLLAAAYTAWLIWIKPLSTELATEIQALISVFLGTTASVLVTAGLDPIFIVVPAMVIGYGASRHILAQRDETNFTIITLVYAIIFGEIAWILHSWLIVYMFNSLGFIIPQLSIILTLIFFTINYIFKSISKNEKIQISQFLAPTFFTLLVIIVIILFFSKPIFNV